MISRFLEEANERDADIHKVLRQIRGLSLRRGDDFYFSLIEKDENVVGYFYMECRLGEYDEREVIFHHLYVPKEANESDLVKTVEKMAVDWARHKEAKSLAFLTQRNPLAFLRKLGDPWKIYTVEMRRRV